MRKRIFDLRGKFTGHLNHLILKTKNELTDEIDSLNRQLKSNEETDWMKDSQVVNTHQRIDDLNEEDEFKYYKLGQTLDDLRDSKVVVFKREQAEVFLHLAEKQKIDLSWPYRLPYPSILIQFDNLISLDKTSPLSGYKVGGVLLTQSEMGDCYADFIFSDLDYFHIAWDVDEGWSYVPLVEEPYYDDDMSEEYATHLAYICQDTRHHREKYLISFACALIMFINSDNVTLVRQEQSVASVKKGKNQRLENQNHQPYYVCRIRGVQYDSEGNEKGTGSKQSIRYDVRGHFRRYESGKTTWVRAHQRGLSNELYVPKTYVVDKKAQA